MSCTNPNLWYGKNHTHHSQFSDSEFVEAFERGSLNPKLFNHEAHLRLAWIYIQSHGEQKAIEKTCAGIKHFDILHGDGTKFNAEITTTAIRVMNGLMEKSESTSFQGLLEEFPQLVLNFKDLVSLNVK
ncbi:MAG: hypothetical protein RIM83_03495 [Allomuricauda sp.]